MAAKCIIVFTSKMLICLSAVWCTAGSSLWVFKALLLKQLPADEENDTMRTVRMNKTAKWLSVQLSNSLFVTFP